MNISWRKIINLVTTGLMGLALAYTCVANAKQTSAGQITWGHYSNSVFTKATKENKRILLYGYASWCHYCQHMQETTLTNPAVIDMIQANYIPVKVNIDSDADIAKQYHIDSYPTIIILDGKQQTIAEFNGYMPAEDLLAKLRSLK